MNKAQKIIFLFLVSSLLLISGLWTNAAGLIPCGGRDLPSCRLCHFLMLVRNITDFILKVLVPLGILLIVVGGIIIAASRNTSIARTGKKLIRSALTGIIIAFVAWFIVDGVIVFFLRPGIFPFPWYAWDLQCPTVKISLPGAMSSSYTVVIDTNPTGVSPGDTIKYTLTYTNTSDKNINNLNIEVDYDQTMVTSISNISSGGTDDGNKINWIIARLNAGQPVTVSYDFVLTTDYFQLLQHQSTKDKQGNQISKFLLNIFPKPVLAQVPPFIDVYYRNLVTVSSNEADTESLNDPLKITLSNTIFAYRSYYLVKDQNDGTPSVGDEIRYNIKYSNPTLLDFQNVIIVSDYDQNSVTINKIDGGGTDDGDKITWNLGNLSAGQPPAENPACIGYSFTIKLRVGEANSNIFNLFSNGDILETNNDSLKTP